MAECSRVGTRMFPHWNFHVPKPEHECSAAGTLAYHCWEHFVPHGRTLPNAGNDD
nr:hypothetical protein [uncultured Prevotella sp.]